MMSLDRQSATYVDNRNFPGIDGELPPGPLGYEVLGGSDPFIIIPNLTTMLNQWLADGLLVGSVSVSVNQISNVSSSQAVSLPHYLWHELLDYRFSMLPVLGLCWYVSESLTSGRPRT